MYRELALLVLTSFSPMLVAQGASPPVQPPGANVNPGNQQPSTGNMVNGQNAMVDGVYTILAYEKFGRPVIANNNVRVVIRGNILSFPGDAKMPGKMIQLNFGPNNTVTVTPMDGTVPLQNQTNNTLPSNQSGTVSPDNTSTRQAAGVPPVNNTGAVTGNNPARNAQGSPTGEIIRQASGTPPLNNGQMGNTNQGAGSTAAPNNGTTNNMQNYPGVESGVYVQSNEFLSIAINSQGGGGQPVVPPGNPVVPPGNPGVPPGQPVPPGRPVPPANPIEKHGSPTTGNPTSPRIMVPGTTIGNPTNPNMSQTNPVQNNGGFVGPSSAVIVLRRVAN